MNITHENYFSTKSSLEYLSASQYKDFVGSLGMLGCEAKAMAKIRGEWKQKMTTPLLVGSYVDAHFEGTIDLFKAKNPEVFTQKGELKSTFKQAEDIILRIERDPLMMATLTGEKQVIMTAEFFGAKWKCKIDCLDRDKFITDLKVMKSLTELKYVADHGKLNFIEYWGYDIQGAIYQKIVDLNINKRLPFFITGASKEEITDIEVIHIDNTRIDALLIEIETNVQRILDVKNGVVEADRCETCDYCTFTKVLKAPIHYSELAMKL